MAQKQLLWVEVGAHVVRKRSKRGEVLWASAGAAWYLRACVGVCVIFVFACPFAVCVFFEGISELRKNYGIHQAPALRPLWPPFSEVTAARLGDRL